MPEAKIKRINTLKAVCIEVGDTFRDKYAFTLQSGSNYCIIKQFICRMVPVIVL